MGGSLLFKGLIIKCFRSSKMALNNRLDPCRFLKLFRLHDIRVKRGNTIPICVFSSKPSCGYLRQFCA